jgi:hypothetical protein
MFRNSTPMVAGRFADPRIQAEECQHTADLFPEDRMGQEFAELARRWRLIAEQSGPSLRLPLASPTSRPLTPVQTRS